MKIYQDQRKKHILLDPDSYYENQNICNKLYSFYQSMITPDHVEEIVGISIRFEVYPFQYESNPIIYQKFSPQIINVIQSFLNDDNAYLYNDGSNDFFIVMFDKRENELNNIFKNLKNEFKNNQFQYQGNDCSIHIKTGICYAYSNINAYILYEACKQALENILKHQNVYLTIYHL